MDRLPRETLRSLVCKAGLRKNPRRWTDEEAMRAARLILIAQQQSARVRTQEELRQERQDSAITIS